MAVRRITDETAREIHERWRGRNEEEGIKSRESVWGEELMRPWEALSERAKDLNREMVRATLKALAELV